MKKIIIANWKMKLDARGAASLAKQLVRASGRVSKSERAEREVVLCPDYLSLSAVAGIIRGRSLRLGAQDSAATSRGALTGEVSPADLKALGVRYVILGHSERREHLHENSAIINAKIKAALEKGLIPVLCVGEKLAERKSGGARQYLNGELSRALKSVKIKNAASLIIAYEPIWAISSARGAKPLAAFEASAIHKFIKERASRLLGKSPRVLYGGSVSAANAADLLRQPDIDGLLVGSASLNSREFMSICFL